MDKAHELVLRYVVKEFFQVDINYPLVALIQINKQLSDCHFTASVWSEAITPFRKQRLAHGAYHLHNALLNYPVHYGRNTEFSHSTVWLGYFYPPDRLGVVLPLPDLLSDTVPILFDIIAEFVYSHVIYTTCSFIGADSLVCGVHVVVGQYLFQQF